MRPTCRTPTSGPGVHPQASPDPQGSTLGGPDALDGQGRRASPRALQPGHQREAPGPVLLPTLITLSRPQRQPRARMSQVFVALSRWSTPTNTCHPRAGSKRSRAAVVSGLLRRRHSAVDHSWIHRRSGYPIASARRPSSPGAGVRIVHRMRCSTRPHCSRPTLRQARRRDGIPALHAVVRQNQQPACHSGAMNTGQQRRPVTWPDHRSRPLTAHRVQSSKLSLSKREADAKWPRVRRAIIKEKQHVKRYPHSATDEPFLSRVSQVRILSGRSIATSEVPARQPVHGGLWPHPHAFVYVRRYSYQCHSPTWAATCARRRRPS
jgi:hypothetical protein